LTEAGWRVVVISTREGEPEPGGVDRSDPVQRRFLTDEGVRERLTQTRRAEFYSPDDFGLVVYAGGGGALLDLPGDTALAEFTGEVVATGGVIAACGHGVAGLLNVRVPDKQRLLVGRALTAPTPVEERMLALDAVLPFSLAAELARGGAQHRFGEPFKPYVMRDGSLLTGQNPASAPELARRIINATTGLSPGGGTAMRLTRR
jgi:putative intracellular protease/amidase